MSDAAPGSSNVFTKGFLPGLVVGLIVGLAVGAFVPGLMSGPEIPKVDPARARTTPAERNERATENPAEAQPEKPADSTPESTQPADQPAP